MPGISHRERLELILAGQTPDRFAASCWRHFFHMEHSAEGTAEAMIGFQKRFDWDFVKINPRADYHIEDWGFRQEYSRHEFRKHEKLAYPITRPENWDALKVNPPTSRALAEHLKLISLVRKGVGRETPILMTVFTPLAIAGRMVENQQDLIDELRRNPSRIHRALRVITDTFKTYAAEIRNAGADGLFFATTQWASRETISWEEYQIFGTPYDLEVVAATEESALNLLHICAGGNFLSEMAPLDYHCRLYNWDSLTPTNLPLDRAHDLLVGKVLVGGLDHNGWLLYSSPQEIVYQIQKLKTAHDPSRVILGPGCAVPPETPMDNLRALRETLS